MRDHIEKVNPAGVIAVGYNAEICPWVIPPMRNGESGILTSDVNPITTILIMRRRKRIEKNMTEVLYKENVFAKEEI